MEQVVKLDVPTRLALQGAAQVVLYLWTRYVIAPASAGRARVLCAVPALPIIWFLTSVFDIGNPDEFLLAAHGIVNFFWLTSSKLWSFCMNRGQVAKSYDSGSHVAFALALLFPLTVDFKEIPLTEEKEHASKTAAYTDVRFEVIRFSMRGRIEETGKTLLRVVTKVMVILAMEKGYYYFGEKGYPFWRDVCVGWFLYCVTSMIQDIMSLAILLTLNVKLAANFDWPFLSTSLQELWSRRYNMTFSETLRDLVYYPILDGSLVHPPTYYQDKEALQPMRKIVAILATFFASGVCHSLVLAYGTYMDFPIMHCLFFVMCALVIVLEVLLKSFVKEHGYQEIVARCVPTWVYRVYFLGIQFYLLHKFFLVELAAAGFTDDYVKGMIASFRLN